MVMIKLKKKAHGKKLGRFLHDSQCATKTTCTLTEARCVLFFFLGAPGRERELCQVFSREREKERAPQLIPNL